MANSTYRPSDHPWTMAYTPRKLAEGLLTKEHKSFQSCKLVLFIHDDKDQLLIYRTYNRNTKQLYLNHLPHLDVRLSSGNKPNMEEQAFNALTEKIVANELGSGDASRATVLYASPVPAHKQDGIAVFIACRVCSTDFAVMEEVHEWLSEAKLKGFYLNDWRFQLGETGLQSLLESVANWKQDIGIAKKKTGKRPVLTLETPSPTFTVAPVNCHKYDSPSIVHDDGYDPDTASDFQNDVDGFTSDDMFGGYDSPLPELRESRSPNARGARATLPATANLPAPLLSRSEMGLLSTHGRGIQSDPSTPVGTDDGYEADVNEGDDRHETPILDGVGHGPSDKLVVNGMDSRYPTAGTLPIKEDGSREPTDDGDDGDSHPDLVENEPETQPANQLAHYRPSCGVSAPLVSAPTSKSLAMPGAHPESGFEVPSRFAMAAEKIAGVRHKRRVHRAQNKKPEDRRLVTVEKRRKELRLGLK